MKGLLERREGLTSEELESEPDYASFSAQREDLRDNIESRRSDGLWSRTAGFVEDYGPEITYFSLGLTLTGVSVYVADPELQVAVNDLLGSLF